MGLKRVNVVTVDPGSVPPNPGPNAANLVYDIHNNVIKAVLHGGTLVNVTSSSSSSSSGSTSGSSSTATSITRTALNTKISGSQLLAGEQYLITDSANGGSILVVASGVNNISPKATWIRTTSLFGVSKFQISGGAGGNISQIAINSTNLMTSTITYDTSRIETATQVVDNINNNSGTSGYRAWLITGDQTYDKPYIAIEKLTANTASMTATVTSATLTIADNGGRVGVAPTTEVYEITYNIATDAILKCYDPIRNVTFITTSTDITSYGYNPISNFRWGDNRFRDITFDSVNWKNVACTNAATTGAYSGTIGKAVNFESFLWRFGTTQFNNVTIGARANFSNTYVKATNGINFSNSIIGSDLLFYEISFDSTTSPNFSETKIGSGGQFGGYISSGTFSFNNCIVGENFNFAIDNTSAITLIDFNGSFIENNVTISLFSCTADTSEFDNSHLGNSSSLSLQLGGASCIFSNLTLGTGSILTCDANGINANGLILETNSYLGLQDSTDASVVNFKLGKGTSWITQIYNGILDYAEFSFPSNGALSNVSLADCDFSYAKIFGDHFEISKRIVEENVLEDQEIKICNVFSYFLNTDTFMVGSLAGNTGTPKIQIGLKTQSPAAYMVATSPTYDGAKSISSPLRSNGFIDGGCSRVIATLITGTSEALSLTISIKGVFLRT